MCDDVLTSSRNSHTCVQDVDTDVLYVNPDEVHPRPGHPTRTVTRTHVPPARFDTSRHSPALRPQSELTYQIARVDDGQLIYTDASIASGGSDTVLEPLPTAPAIQEST